MRISDWSSDVCSSDLGNVEEYLAQPLAPCGLPGEEQVNEDRSRLSRCGKGDEHAATPQRQLAKQADFNSLVRWHRYRCGHWEGTPFQRGKYQIPTLAPTVSSTAGRSRGPIQKGKDHRSEENTSELQPLMRNSYAGLCLTKQHTTWRTACAGC